MYKSIVATMFAILICVLNANAAKTDEPYTCDGKKSGKIKEYKLEEGKILPFAINKRLSRKRGNAWRGQRVFTNPKKGNCIACHAVKEQQNKINQDSFKTVRTFGFPGNLGPALDGVGAKYTPGELRVIIVDSRIAFPTKESSMPPFYKVEGLKDVVGNCVGKTILSEQEIEDLVRYLGTLK